LYEISNVEKISGSYNYSVKASAMRLRYKERPAFKETAVN
jgi:hypothetical protein